MYFAENMKGWQLVYEVLTLGAAEFGIFLGNLQCILLMKIIITWKK